MNEQERVAQTLSGRVPYTKFEDFCSDSISAEWACPKCSAINGYHVSKTLLEPYIKTPQKCHRCHHKFSLYVPEKYT